MRSPPDRRARGFDVAERRGSWLGPRRRGTACASRRRRSPRRMSTRAVVSLTPSASASRRASAGEPDATVHCTADPRYGGGRTEHAERPRLSWATSDGDELLLRRGLRGRVPRPTGSSSTGATSRSGSIAAAVKLGLLDAQRAGRGRDRRSRRARRRRADREPRSRLGCVPRPPLGAGRRWSGASRSSTGCASSSSAAPGSTTASRRACSRWHGTTRRPTSPTATRAATARCSSSRRCRPGTSCSSGAESRLPALWPPAGAEG